MSFQCGGAPLQAALLPQQCRLHPCIYTQADTEAIAAAASNLAGLVGLDADDIASVLLPGPSQPSSAAGELESAAQQARQALQQAEAQLAAGSWQDDGCAALLAAVAPLQERCAQVHAALAGAVEQSCAERPLPPGEEVPDLPQRAPHRPEPAQAGRMATATVMMTQRTPSVSTTQHQIWSSLQAAAAEVAELEARLC